jgi:hypothetical protein
MDRLPMASGGGSGSPDTDQPPRCAVVLFVRVIPGLLSPATATATATATALAALIQYNDMI